MSIGDVVREHGWLRSVGSANPYLALWVRGGRGAREVEAAVAAREIVEVPAARGCTYYVPAEDAALALALARLTGGDSGMRTARKYLGVTDEEIERLEAAVLAALADGLQDPRALAARIGDAARSLGPEGKKRGQTTTLPLALGRLQLAGRIRRIPEGGRLDGARFSYALWPDGPEPLSLSEPEVAAAMAERFARWTGGGSLVAFRSFTGLPVRLVRVYGPESGERPALPEVAFVSSLDPAVHLRETLAELLEPGDVLGTARGVTAFESHPILARGRVAGLWEYDPEAGEIVAQVWRPSPQIESARVRTEAYIRDELGDFRSMTLDSPASRRPRIEALRAK